MMTLPGFGVRIILTSWNELGKLQNHLLPLVSVICVSSRNLSILSKLSNLLMYSYSQYSLINHLVMSHHPDFGHLSFLSYSLGQFSQKFDNVVYLFKKSTFDIFIFDNVVDLFKKSTSDFFISSIIFMFSISFISLLIVITFSLLHDWI